MYNEDMYVKHYNESEATSQRRPSTRDQSLSRSGLLNVCLDESKVRNSRVSFDGNNNSKMGVSTRGGQEISTCDGLIGNGCYCGSL